MLLAKRTPPCSSPAARPCWSSRSGGCTETRRDLPSARASLAALRPAARAQPPPNQPSEIVPSGRITAFAPAFAAVAATVRTTVASATGSPAALRAEMMPRMSDARSTSYPREIRFERRQAFKIVRGREQVDIGQRRLHAARLRAVVAPADQGIEPGDAPTAATQAAHFLAQHFGRAGIVTVGDDHHRSPRIDHAFRVPAIERGEAFSDLRASANALCHQRQFIHCARDIAVAQRRGYVGKSRVEDESLRFTKRIDDAVQKPDKKRSVETHGAGSVEQKDEPKRLDLATAPREDHQRAAVRYVSEIGRASCREGGRVMRRDES